MESYDRKWRTLWEQGVLADPRYADLVAEIDPATDDGLVRGAVEWLLASDEAAAVVAQGRVPLTVLRYEDLLTDPETQTRRLLEVCDLAPAPQVLAFARENVTPPRREATLPDGLPPALVDHLQRALAEAGYPA